MINVLMLFSSQVVDGSPRLCGKDKANKTNHQQSPRIIAFIVAYWQKILPLPLAKY
jgi:hypothetical protein